MNSRLELINKVVDRVTIGLIFLKVFKAITTSWWLVLMPIWLFAGLALLILVVHSGEVIRASRYIRST
jgi:hypothetical protein